MFNFRLAAVVILLQYSPCIYAGGSCQENIYLEVGKQGVVSCDFENFDIIGWINGDGNVRDTSPFIYIEGSKIYGRGYRSGDYDMHPNGSLIINEVKLKNEFNYTVLLVPPGGGNEYFKVPVKVYVPPDPGYPVVNGRTNQVVIHGKTRGFINCSMTGIRPRVDLEWVASPDEISLNSSHRVTDNSDGTYNTYLNSSYKVVNSPTGRVSSKCRVAGDLAAFIPLETTVYLLLEQRFPVLNGLANQQHVVLDVNREGELTCSMDKVLQDVSLELVTIFPDSSDEILLDNKYNITVNGDDTVNITLTSRFQVLSDSTQHFTLKCRVSGQAADKYPEATTVELLVTESFPVVNGLANQQHVVLHVNREGELTFSMDKVSQDVSLELVTIFPDSSDEILLDNRNNSTANEDGTVNITLTSKFRVLKRSIRHFTLQCRVTGQAADKYPEATTVELLVTENFPVINGLVHQQHIVLEVSREDKLTCTMNRVSQTMVLEWVFIPPVSPDEISIENELSKTDNRDGTSNITLSSSFCVLSQSIQHVTLECRVVDENDGSQHDVTTVELLFDNNFPVVNGLDHQQHIVLEVSREDKLTCTMKRVSQTMVLEWVFTPPVSPDEISMDNELSKTDNRDGTSNITLSSSFRVLSQSIHHVTLECRVVDENDGSQHDVTTVELLFDNNVPVVNGLVHQQHVVLNVNREDKLTCSMNRVSQTMVLKWVFTPPVSPDEISIENELSKTDNRDGTSNITLSSSFRVLSQSIHHVTLECRVVDENDGSQHDVTTVELLFDKNFPVVNGLVHQQHVVLNVNREDKLTCTMNRVSQTMVLEWVFTPPVSHNEISIENELSKTDNRDDGTSNITLSSSFRVLSQSIHHVTLECRVVDENDGSQHDVTTVELLFDKTTDQEVESLLSWQSNLTTVLLVFLVVNVIIFWLIFVYLVKRHKNFARKYHKVFANPGYQTDLEEAGAAEHSSRQEEEIPLQPANNEDNIDVTSQNKEILQKCTTLISLLETLTDSGLSSSLNSSMASETFGNYKH
ncbi:uncharacterized protein [Apostichopus japonicus]|uniref:uncharacterized protein isoform X13 n=1 Tax=Stichopus japonicus TaxID=307972 RepID=UPI003AB46023